MSWARARDLKAGERLRPVSSTQVFAMVLNFGAQTVDRELAMNLTEEALQTGSGCGHDHLVQFYDTETFLVDTVRDFLAPALSDGDAAIVVATGGHQDKFETALRTTGVDVDTARHQGRYLAFDAAAVLSRFMANGAPDPTLFRETIGAVMDRVSHNGRRIRVYGEMVALLWDDGNVASVLALEDLWNDLAAVRPFLLLCAYPMRAFDDQASTGAFRAICEQHTTVIPSESYSLLADPAERSRGVAQLQQQTAGLHAEIRRLRAQLTNDGAGDHREATVGQRDHAVDQRDHAGHRRDQAGDQRDQAGDQRDHAGELRDEAAELRDEAAELRDEAAERSEASVEAGITTAALNHSARARREAASDRRRASQDRRAGATERTKAELDRNRALADRGASAKERDGASLDDLTGVYLRGPGFVELEREIARARRTQQPLVLAFVDVDHLKNVNDSRGHGAGDRMLVDVAGSLRAKMRPYDLIVRYGGDEFVWAMSGLDMAEATKRVALVDAALAAAPDPASVTVGLAELRPDDSPEVLVARADAQLYRKRREQRTNRA